MRFVESNMERKYTKEKGYIVTDSEKKKKNIKNIKNKRKKKVGTTVGVWYLLYHAEAEVYLFTIQLAAALEWGGGVPISFVHKIKKKRAPRTFFSGCRIWLYK